MRLRGRDTALRIFEGLFRSSLEIKRGGTRRPRFTAEPEPNAPLLIRIVRYPYRQETHRGRRRQVFEAGLQVREKLDAREAPMRSARDYRGDAITGNPIKALGIHPSPLAPPPSIEEWLGAVGPRDLPARPAADQGGR